MVYKHVPVMLKEIIENLNPKAGENFIDCTLGGGGYSFAIAKLIGQQGKILAIDLDELAINNAKQQIIKNKLANITLVHDNFKNLIKIFKKYFKNERQVNGVDGIVFDLGLSSAQLQDQSRGFSFRVNAPLRMNFNSETSSGLTAAEIINTWSQLELEKIIKEYGEERFARSISRKIVESRKNKKIITTDELVNIIKSSVPKKYLYAKIHPATRTFQALRIAVNDELNSLKEVLPQALELLKPGGHLVVISFHSLEDRIVKHFFKNEAKDCICPPSIPLCQCNHIAQLKIITKKPILPSQEEISKNPRSRSAKLRVAIKK